MKSMKKFEFPSLHTESSYQVFAIIKFRSCQDISHFQHQVQVYIPRTTLRFNNSLEGLTELRKDVMLTVFTVKATD